jgi:hypothetical protein
MLMIRNGEPFVPPTCPVEREGQISMIRPEQFELYIDHAYQGDTAYISGMFREGESDGDVNTLSVGPLRPELTSDLTDRALDTDFYPDASRRLGEILCDRVINCRGIENGLCWALNTTAFENAIIQASDELYSGEPDD